MPQPGDVGLVTTTGLGPDLIRLGDKVYAKRTHTRHEPFNHAVVAVGNGLAVSGDPHGAQLCSASSWRSIDWRTYRRALTPTERFDLAAAARALVGTPYSWVDIAALTLQDFGWRTQYDDGQPTLLGERIADQHRLVCSQLVALVYAQVGLPLFVGRAPGEVTPGDLGRCPLLLPTT